MPEWQDLEPHIPGVYRYLLRLCHDSHWAEDLTQEVMLRAWKYRKQLDHQKLIRIWIFRIARNLLVDELRYQRRRPKTEHAIQTLEDKTVGAPDEQTLISEQREKVLETVDALPLQQREVMFLSVVEGLGISEIAELMNIQSNSVRVCLHKARKKMRQVLFPSESVHPPEAT